MVRMNGKMCKSCPFNYESEASHQAQNYGCLPSGYQILKIKDETGHNWACHSNNNRICNGLSKYRDTSIGKLYLQPIENSNFISWNDEDLKPILK